MTPDEMHSSSDARHAAEAGVGPGSATIVSMRCPTSDGHNEDAAAVLPIDDRRAVLVVADGLGGRPSGELASRTVVRALAARIRKIGSANGVRDAILDAIDEAGRNIAALGLGAGSTVAVVEVDGTRVRPYHVGDSEILVVGQRGRIKLRSLSHSPTAYAVESGMLDASAALRHEDRHLISSVVGDPGMRIEIGSWLALAPRDTVVLGTDGVFDNLEIREIADAVRIGALPNASRRLADACVRRMIHPARNVPSKPDDLTFILFRPVPAGATRTVLPLVSPGAPAVSHAHD